MALPLNTDIDSLNYNLYGEPFLPQSNSNIDVQKLNYNLYGEPFIANSSFAQSQTNSPLFIIFNGMDI
jgi:hypothetical protein